MDKFDKNKIELSKDNLSDLEVKKIQINIQKKVKKNNKIGLIKVAIFAGISTTIVGMVTPAIAKNMPVIDSIYSEVIKDRDINYMQELGEQKKFDGGYIIVDNFIFTRNRIDILAKVVFDEKLLETERSLIQLVGEWTDDLKKTSYGTISRDEWIDEKTLVLEYTFRWHEEDIENNKIDKFNFVLNNGNKNIAKFSIDSKIADYLDDIKIIDVNKDINTDMKIKTLESTVLQSKVKIETNLNELNQITNSLDSSNNIIEKNNILIVDGKEYVNTEFITLGKEFNNLEYIYDGLTSEIIEGATSIEFVNTTKGIKTKTKIK